MVAAATEWGANCASTAQPGKRNRISEHEVQTVSLPSNLPTFAFPIRPGANGVATAQIGKHLCCEYRGAGCKRCRIRPDWQEGPVIQQVQTVRLPPNLATRCAPPQGKRVKGPRRGCKQYVYQERCKLCVYRPGWRLGDGQSGNPGCKRRVYRPTWRQVAEKHKSYGGVIDTCLGPPTSPTFLLRGMGDPVRQHTAMCCTHKYNRSGAGCEMVALHK
jgi:hypothetical protein